VSEPAAAVGLTGSVVLLAALAIYRLHAAARQARSASRMKSSFLASMSHEIRTPLGGVIGMLTLLAQTQLSDEQREYLATADASSQALMSLIDDILDLSKIEAGRLELEYRDFDLFEAVENACVIVAGAAGDKGLELHSFLAQHVPRYVRGDRLRLSQILTNLLSNAIKFTHEGQVDVELLVEREQDDRTLVRFEIEDTGIGIPSQSAERLFEPFTQGDADTSRRFGGTGLGLAIIRELVRLMGGEISHRARPGGGSSFRFTVPFELGTRPSTEPLEPVNLDGSRILLVENSATNLRILEAYATAWGMRPTAVPDAARALAALRAAVDAGEPFAVAVIDCQFADLAREILATPALRGTRLIMLASSTEQRTAVRELNVHECLTKPIRRSRLLEAISSAMRPPAAARLQEPARARGSARPGTRILVAEDHPANQLVIRVLLERRGLHAECVADGNTALAALESGNYDLILMDCQMPALDGYEATREIRRRERRRGSGHIPIVALTAHALEGDRRRCLAAGMDDYLAKPLRQDELDAVLDRWLVPGAESGAVLNPDRYDELRGSFTDEEMAELLQAFAASMPGLVSELYAAAEQGDPESVRAAAHRIQGSASSIGATALVSAAVALEQRASARDQLDPNLIAELKEDWRRTHEALERRLKMLGRHRG
jgi:two-component system sensor histidine kinase/response regulator